MPSEQIKSEQPKPQTIPRLSPVTSNRQGISGGASSFAHAFDTATQVAGATVPRFSGSTVINAAVSAAANSRMAIEGGPPLSPGAFGGGYGGGMPGPGGIGGGDSGMGQMTSMIDRMAATGIQMMGVQYYGQQVSLQQTAQSNILKQDSENKMNTVRNIKVS